jgi:hypothetical protein
MKFHEFLFAHSRETILMKDLRNGSKNSLFSTDEALNREISDHTPLLLSAGEGIQVKNRPMFIFELDI